MSCASPSDDDPNSLAALEVSPSGMEDASANGDARFRGKTIVITGAGGQLGRAGCIYFAARGASIAALDKNEAGLRETLAECATGSNIKPYICDVTKEESIDAVFSAIADRFGSIDLVWNNAGYQGQIAPILEQDPKDFDLVMRVNVTGVFLVLQAAAKRMKLTGGGAIVNTASVAGLRGTPAMPAYASSKAAVICLTVTAAKELAIHNIRVNALSPALIGPGTLWERQNKLHAAVGPPYFAASEEDVASSKVNSVPMKRLGSPEEVIQSLAFLFSGDSSYTTGINLVIDGGMAAGLKA